MSFFAGWALSLDYILTIAISGFFVPQLARRPCRVVIEVSPASGQRSNGATTERGVVSDDFMKESGG